jgi:cardiolipin synthase
VKRRPDWLPGNRITLLENGEQFYPRVFESIAAARREVLVETFIWFDDKVGRALRDVLAAAARRGVRVHVLFDGWGSPGIDAEFSRSMIEAGVQLRAFEPVQWLLGVRVNLLRRMHRKLAVVDGERAFVGGINYSADHLADYGPEAKQDYAVEVEGPLVAEIHAFCLASLETPQPARERWRLAYRRFRDRHGWRDWAGSLRRHARGRAAAAGSAAPGAAADLAEGAAPGALAAFVTRDNHFHRDDIERQYRLAMRLARERIVIANAYFFPGWRLLHEMRRAARRGVQVDLVLQGEADMAIVKTAASMLHAHLVGSGVRVFEYCERPLHGKVAVIDDTWATVGSSNLDPISLGLNLEANVLVRDREFAVELRRRLDHLMRHRCRQVQVESPGWLLAGWIALRSTLVFHFLRRFPRWALQLPRQAAKVAPLQAKGA